MNDSIKSKFISDIRLSSYIDFDEYKKNMILSQEYYILLSIFEISLKNSIDNYYRKKFSNNWLSHNFLHKDSQKKIEIAKLIIVKDITHDKIIAQLSFGFWTTFFRSSYSNNMRIKDIRNIFPNIPSKSIEFINRSILDKRLNKIRKFRNRIFHYEKIINKAEYLDMKNEILTLLNYFDRDIYNFAKDMLNISSRGESNVN